MSQNEISSFIWSVCDDILRGLFKPHEYGDIILPFTVLRRLDCVIEDKKDEIIQLHENYKNQLDDTSGIIKGETKLSFFNHSHYDLSRLRHDPSNVYINFQNYIGGFSENVVEIIENFQLDKPVEKLNRENRLFKFIDKFSEVDLHPDKVSNHMMGQIFEELLRRFSEMSNETSGEHYTPRDVVRLLVSLVFSEDIDNLKGKGIIRSIFDPCCGSGGMLTLAKEWVNDNVSDQIQLRLVGQEINPQTFALCKSDVMITGEDPENIRLGNSLSRDQFCGDRFDYMITNPPYGVSWEPDKEVVKNECQNPNGRFSVGTPRISDGQLLFLQHMISKMEDGGSRIGVVFNGSPLFTGDAGSGESDIRKWIIENDWLECIISLPDQLFFNTGITTYLWILANKKSGRRRGKVQLIDGSSLFVELKKSLGNKRKALSLAQRNEILNLYLNFEEREKSKIYPNNFFGYTKIQVEQPVIEDGIVVIDKRRNPKPDTSKRTHERVSLLDDIDKYYEREVKPQLPNAWVDRTKDKIGYEINFTKYFYEFKPLRPLEDITQDLLKLNEEIECLMKEVIQE